MKKFAILLTSIATLGLSACVAPIDDLGEVVVPLPIPVPVPVSTPDVVKKSDSIHVCKIKAFTDTYQSENQNRGKARLDAKKQCTANYHEMFCRDEYIKCTEYN